MRFNSLASSTSTRLNVLLREERRELVVNAVEEARFARQRCEGNDPVLVHFDDPLDRIGEQPPDVLHALLLV